MIVTDRFVLLNYPRTGSTFVRDALKRIHAARDGAVRRLVARTGLLRRSLDELILPIDRTSSARREGRRSQHGRYGQIPREHRGKVVVSVLRNPYDRAVSTFEHGFWRDHPPDDPERVRERYPSFPELSFDEYLRMTDELGRDDVRDGAAVPDDVGAHSLHFLRFYSRDPDALLRTLSNVPPIDTLRDGLGDVRFLRFERLREELAGFLHEFGYTREHVRVVHELPRRNEARTRADRSWRDYFTPALATWFRTRERTLFELFPEHDERIGEAATGKVLP